MRRDQFADRKIMEYEAVVNGHSGLMPSNLSTFAHFSVSPETNFANPSGVSPRMTTPAARSASLHGSLAPTDLSLLHVRFPMWSGPHLLMLSVTCYDPKPSQRWSRVCPCSSRPRTSHSLRIREQ